MSPKGVDRASLSFVFLLCQLCRPFDKELGVFGSFELSLQHCATVDCSTTMMVDLLGCSSRWQEVEDLINPMFCDLPDDAVWMELLGHCSPSCVMWWGRMYCQSCYWIGSWKCCRLCATSNFYDDDDDDDAAGGKWDLTTSVQLQLKGLEGTSARLSWSE
jgi:hypothetical protein